MLDEGIVLDDSSLSGSDFPLEEITLSSSSSPSLNPIWIEGGDDDNGDVGGDGEGFDSLSASGGGSCLGRTWAKVKGIFVKPPSYHPRTISLHPHSVKVDTKSTHLPQNIVSNQKYTPVWTFLFVVLYNEFKFFFNMYFLLVALSQLVPVLRIGYLFTYIAPLVFVLAITVSKEAFDDYQRWKRDREANSQIYHKLTSGGLQPIPSSDIQVGDLIHLNKNDRVPADMILFRTSEQTGATFIRTDQLDGETSWTLRRALTVTQKLDSDASLLQMSAQLYAAKPKLDIYDFVGKFTVTDAGLGGSSVDDTEAQVEGVSLDNTLWTNTVLAAGQGVGCVIYTGSETRSALNTSMPATKVGLLDLEMNRLAKVLFGLTVVLSFIMVAVGGFKGFWGIDLFRFILLFSAIIPISLRVNLDMGKALYSYWINRDDKIPGTVVRTSTIPEELGRINYLLSDKTGTLTQNVMVFKRLHLGSSSFSHDTVDELESSLRRGYESGTKSKDKGVFASKKGGRKSVEETVRTAIEALALCHNVTPTRETEGSDEISYQAASPDEVALVQFTEAIGVTLWNRDLTTMTLKTPKGKKLKYDILHVFPFTSETKRMGIIVKERKTNSILFYMKGADVVMSKIVKSSDWLDEECGNMAREGLRTLVFGMKVMSESEFEAFEKTLKKAKSQIHNRAEKVQSAVESIEKGLELIALSGVEDKLQENVKPTLEMLRNAGIRIWMLTGDKIETATNIAVSSRLVGHSQGIYTISGVCDSSVAFSHLDVFRNKKDTCLVVDGASLRYCMEGPHRELFAQVATAAPSVVCCRCSPTQKADVVLMIKEFTGLQTASIGDGGNDVSMIQAADVGIGIVGKEGRQASLAADFSINQFSYVSRLLIWHGRNSYKRSARLGQFVIHRGLIISFIQAVFSALFYFAAIAIYNGWLLVGYATFYTTLPVFSLVLDTDVTEEIAFQFPELYRELQKGRALSYKTFFVWVAKSIYQGGVIMLLAIFLFDQSLYQVISITFTALILTELVNVAFEIHTWHWMMIVCEVITVVIYFISIAILPEYFDVTFMVSGEFVWKILVIVLVTALPIYLGKFIQRKCFPASYTKLK